MRDNIFKEMIMDSPIAYVSVKGIRDNENKYANLQIIEANQAFLNISSSVKKDIRSMEDIKGLYIKPLNKYNIILKLVNKHFIENSSKEKLTYETYDKIADKYYNIDIYNVDNDIFWIKVIEANNDRIMLSNILNESPFMAWIKDRDGKYIDVNKKFIENSGKKYYEIIGTTGDKIWEQDEAYEYALQDKYVIDTLEKKTYSDILKFGNLEKEKYYETTKWPYLDENNNVIGIIGITLDIVDNIELRQNLQENESKFKEIINYSEEGFFIIENEKITYDTPYFSKIFGQPKERIFDYLNILDKYKNNSINEVISIVDEGGNTKWVWLKLVPIKDERGNIIKHIGIISDISKKKEAELEIERMRNEFFANLSHELRTPINLILGTMQLIDLKLDRLDSKEKNYIKKYNKIITQNGLRLLKLVNNIIDTTKIDSGYFNYNPQNYDIIRFVEDICMSVCDFAKQQDIDLIFDTELEENIMTFDLDMMERIILNLLSNSIKFNKKDGKIEVYISSDDIGNLNISVKDTGRGIPKDKVDSIFSRFNQVDSKSKQEKQGSGIGLSLVKSFIDLHNGNIYVNSELDKGTEFIISIPNIIIESDMEYKIIESDFESQVNRMNVEFSDIYA